MEIIKLGSQPSAKGIVSGIVTLHCFRCTCLGCMDQRNRMGWHVASHAAQDRELVTAERVKCFRDPVAFSEGTTFVWGLNHIPVPGCLQRLL